MDLFKLGLRSVLGITLPGAMLVLIFFYLASTIAFSLNQPLFEHLWGKDQQVLAFAVLFLISYNIGGLLRLNSADSVDRKSSRRLLKHLEREYEKESRTYDAAEEGRLDKIRRKILGGGPPEDIDKFDEWIWRYDTFPYTAWQFRKFQIYHPEEVWRFFRSYLSCMAGSKGRGKEFFNYCKMVIYQSGKGVGDPLVDEVYFAEATVRFYAGTYRGLEISFWLLLALLALQLVLFAPTILSAPISSPKWLNLFATISLIVVVGLMKRTIVGRFRTLRLKEVDTVYDAFYLVHRHADSCARCSSAAPRPSETFAKRESLVLEASLSGEGVLLDRLLSLMRREGEANKNLASLYFAGADVDHPFFLKNDKVAVGLSVLPQDSEKAGISKRHPHQKEVLFILDGSLQLEIDSGGEARRELLREGDVFLIPEGQCHRIRPAGDQPGAFLFVKTRPARQPRGEVCDIPEH
ncbi:MAG TPA: cupin domain-containing protein [Thermoanaerobaculia bacterium]